MMKSKSQKKCEICGKEFRARDVYPISLIRNSVQLVLHEQFPDADEQGFLCFPDLRMIHAEYSEDLIEKEKGALSALEREVVESLKDQDILTENINEEYAEQLTLGEKLADKVAEFGGSWFFISFFGIVLVGWMAINTFYFMDGAFDPYPYILLNLVLSCLAAIQAPIIMMSQNRQAAKDRLKVENDYMVNLKAELQIRHLNARLELFMRHTWQKMHEISRMQEEIYQDLDR
ncbi:MAG: DUF1003 domain-containing protein [Chlamydiales bacterium]|nr:DUF1003 domain-containing protein [Chlamydiia bacterium]MCP5507628.1 DUF1003 domain-containing protein [Chlamydiales bacterium]